MSSVFETTFASLALIDVSLCLSGGATFPALRPADVKLSDGWLVALPHDGKSSERVAWWGTFGGLLLVTLIGLAQEGTPTVASAAADMERARATLASAKANLFPVLDGSAAVTRSATNGDAANRVGAAMLSSGGLDASWEIDLFGKNRQTSDAAGLRVQGRIDDWYDARVSLAAEVADYYVQYRACRQLENAYSVELASPRETIRATEIAAASGLTSSADLALARARAVSSSSTLPAQALRQRPDIGALEREIAASAAEVVAAKADLYPSLSLAGSVAINSSTLTGAALPWSFGPTLTIPLFDGGSRRATVMRAIADHDTAAANYKSGVLSAVAEVQTALLRTDGTRRRIGDAGSAARNYRTYFNSVDKNWRAGGVSLLDREEARRAAPSSEIPLIEIRRDAVRYWIAPYQAPGGGWDAPSSPVPVGRSQIQGNSL